MEVVDFILKSANDALKSEFGVGLTDKNVHILDPFTGTGTFIVRLLQSGIIEDKDLTRKYQEELHANEIILLAYYIAAINIEEAYHDRSKKDYEPFEGIVLTDTFQLTEGKGTFVDEMFPANSDRALKQNKKDIRVIVANPPYSAGQRSENDSNKNLKYNDLDKKIEMTYARASRATLQKNLYDSYIRAIRWASDRIKDTGVICYVSNASFIDGNSMDGLRKCLAEEFSSIYCFNLRGNARTSGEDRRKEMGNVFGGGTRTPVAITLFIKNPDKKAKFQLYYYDIGDYLTREQKLGVITKFTTTQKIPWKRIKPNESHDWINQRDEAFGTFMPVGDKESKGDENSKALFISYSQGVLTSRDAWAYGFSKKQVTQNINRMIDFYGQQVSDFQKLFKKERDLEVEKFVNTDPQKISWSRALKNCVARNRELSFQEKAIRQSSYRPFVKQYLYFDRQLNEMVYKIPIIFPETDSQNLVICTTGVGATNEFSALITDQTPCYDYAAKSQCFPLFIYKPREEKYYELDFGNPESGGKTLNVSDYALREYRENYKDSKMKKEDIFYYVYGVFHSPEYKSRFASDLAKMLPRVPFAEDFWSFSKAGRKLADLHLNYEKAKPYPVKEYSHELVLDAKTLYKVEKMRFGKKAKEVDKSVIHYNSRIILEGIPLVAYEYIVNGKSAIEWIMDRYQLSTDKDSQITNDPNDWAKEHNDPQYIQNLVKSVITVSVETMKIVNALPAIKERKDNKIVQKRITKEVSRGSVNERLGRI